MTGEGLLVIVPALNEEGSIGSVVKDILAVLPAAGVLVVDDGSTDRTAEVARGAGATVASLPYNLGVGGAMRLGYRYALANGYRQTVQVDADGQHDPRFVPDLLARLDDGADLVIGARFAGTGDYVVRGPRRWAMRLLSRVLSALAHTKLTDTTSGFRATGPALIEVFARSYPVEYLGDTVETLAMAARGGYRIEQVPVAMRERAAGVPSHSPVKAAVYLSRAMVTLVLALVRR
jgi:glycosyltransferase involved in cell wall biosynthesis